ncbi:MAG: hypothetical protein QOI99_2101 [Actinomycetota bacterium]|jgi:hypothetical protein|nr:hypothetical protein [Actinomycetota bacterium]
MRRPWLRSGALAGIVVLAAVGGAACGGSAGDEGAVTATTAPLPTPSTAPVPSGPPTVLAIVSPAGGAEVRGNVVRLDLTGSGIAIVGADGDTSGRSGHYHVFVDREPVEPGQVIPVAADIIHTTDDPVVIPGLHVGPHRITVTYGDGTHRRLGPTEAATSFVVTGPSVDASAPPTSPAGQPVVLTVALEGLVLPQDGRLYVLVDADPGPPAEPYGEGVLQSAETTIPVPDLAPGPHTLWVVTGSADGLPLDPPVMDRVTVTVG